MSILDWVFASNPAVASPAADVVPSLRKISTALNLSSPVLLCLFFHTFLHTSDRGRRAFCKYLKRARQSGDGVIPRNDLYVLVLAARSERVVNGLQHTVFARANLNGLVGFTLNDFTTALPGS